MSQSFFLDVNPRPVELFVIADGLERQAWLKTASLSEFVTETE
jgi:hypothetical protein